MSGLEKIEEIKDLIAEIAPVRREQLTSSTRLGHDLGVDGDDAAELMQAFAQRFQADLSEFEFELHFGPEAGFNPFIYLYWLIVKPHELKSVPITVEDLTEAAVHRKWHTPQHQPC